MSSSIILEIPGECCERMLPPDIARELGIQPLVSRLPGREANGLDDQIIVRWPTRFQPPLKLTGNNRVSHRDGVTVIEVPIGHTATIQPA